MLHVLRRGEQPLNELRIAFRGTVNPAPQDPLRRLDLNVRCLHPLYPPSYQHCHEAMVVQK
jgi:hypothetical protein